MSTEVHILPPDDWLSRDWESTTEGDELWLSARNHNFVEAYNRLKQQFGVRNMPLSLIELGWIKYGYEEDDVDHDGDQMYWRGIYRRGSYPIWFIENAINIKKYGGVL